MINNTNINNISKDEISEININNNNTINYGINIKSGFPKNKKKINIEEEISNKTKVNSRFNTINVYSNKKAEFIPPQYNFKFFKLNDKGVVKKIERSQIPFDINKETQILLEVKKDVLYDEHYLEGPFYEDQNIIEIIDDTNIYNDTKNIKFNDNNIPSNNNTLVIKKNNVKNNDMSIKEEIPKTKKE